MRNGIYRIEVSWPATKGCGVATIRDQNLRGVDHECAYIGECSDTGGVSVLSLQRVWLTKPILGANSSQSVTLFGQVDEEGFSLICDIDSTPIAIHGKWIAEA
jgi:hypothetical protein